MTDLEGKALEVMIQRNICWELVLRNLKLHFKTIIEIDRCSLSIFSICFIEI